MERINTYFSPETFRKQVNMFVYVQCMCTHLYVSVHVEMNKSVYTHTHIQFALFYDTAASQIADTFI